LTGWNRKKAQCFAPFFVWRADFRSAFRKEDLMTVAHAFFDESGTHDGAPVLCVAGYVIPEGRLADFNARWSEVLADKVLTYFHMVDCAHGNGEFSGLCKAERIDVQSKLINLIRECTARGIGAMVVAEVYKQLMPFHPATGSAYNYCIWHCFEAVRIWFEEQQIDMDIHYQFERGHQSDGEANRIMNEVFAEPEGRKSFGYASHSFVDKRQSAGIQAADLLAWQMYTDWRHGMESRPRRRDFAHLISDKKHRVCVIDARRILYHVERLKSLEAA